MENEGVKLLLDAANHDVDLAAVGLNAAKHVVEDAAEKIRIVRQQSVDPLGLPFLTDMISKIDEALATIPRFKESTASYRNML